MTISQLQKTVSIRILENNIQTLTEGFSNVSEVDQYVSKQILLAANTIDQEIDINPVTTAKEIYIESEKQITIKLNDVSNPAYIIKDVWYLSTNGITKIYLSNNSNMNSKVKIIIA